MLSVILGMGTALWPAAPRAEEPQEASRSPAAFEGLVTGHVKTFMEVFGERPALMDTSETTRAWMAPGGQRVERGDPGKPTLLALQRRAGVPAPYACTVIQQMCLPIHDGSPGFGLANWKVERKGRATVAGVTCDLVAMEAPSARLELCVTRELGPGGIWLQQWVPRGSVASVERALAQAGLGDFPLRVKLWQGRPQHEVEVTSVARKPVQASSFDLPEGCKLLP